jgi:Carboxypeptidase regulatory-like domain/TonB-dependent Receptor Plug Domain
MCVTGRTAACALLHLLALTSLYPAGLFAQSVSGTVHDKTSGAAVAGAAVLLLDTRRNLKSAVQTNADGRYAVSASAPGRYILSIQKAGVTTVESETLTLTTDSPLVRNFELTIAPPKLAPITVTGKAVVNTSGPNSHKYDEFLLRRSVGIGTFLTREQIEAKPASQTQQLFQNIPGLKISQHGTQWFIRSQRCPAKLPTGEPDPDPDRDYADLPIIFIDGFQTRGLNSLNMVNPSDIEGIEVYQGAAQLPAVAKGNACAAIFVWLKQRR